jgi:hypothetical protein
MCERFNHDDRLLWVIKWVARDSSRLRRQGVQSVDEATEGVAAGFWTRLYMAFEAWSAFREPRAQT